MDELIERVAAAADIPADKARRAVALVLAFLQREAPAEFAELEQHLPGAGDAVSHADAENGGGPMGGMMKLFGGAGGLMTLAAQLTGIGLGAGEMTSVGREILGYAREKAGPERVARVAAAIPGLGGFL